MNPKQHGPLERRPWRRLAPALTLVALGGFVTACTSDQGSASGGDGDAGESVSVIMVGHGPETDPSAVLAIQGMNDACDQLGYTCKYRGPTTETFSAADQAKLIDAAVAENPDGLIVSDPTPEGLNASIQSAVDAGIEVAIFNQGTETDVEATGALQAVAADPYTTGNLAGQAMAAAGVEHPLLLTVVPGIPFVDQRVAGFLDAFPDGAVNELQLPLDTINNPTAVVEGLKAELAQDQEVDGVLSVGVLFNPPMVAVREQLGDRADSIEWASIDVGDAAFEALRAGDMLFAADEQPYLHGYLPVQTIHLALQGISPGEPFIRSGPVFVTPDNVDEYAAAVEAGVRG